jgi:hypothetical protein
MTRRTLVIGAICLAIIGVAMLPIYLIARGGSESSATQAETAEVVRPEAESKQRQRIAEERERERNMDRELTESSREAAPPDDQASEAAKDEEPRPWEVYEYTGLFRKDEAAAKRLIIGKRVALTGYLCVTKTPLGTYVSISTHPLDGNQVRESKQFEDGKVIICYLNPLHANWRMIDGERKVVVVGRAVQPDALDDCSWEFAD